MPTVRKACLWALDVETAFWTDGEMWRKSHCSETEQRPSRAAPAAPEPKEGPAPCYQANAALQVEGKFETGTEA